MLSYDSFLYQQPKKYFLLVLFVASLFISTIIILLPLKTYDVHHVHGLVECSSKCVVKIHALPEEISRIYHADHLKINHQLKQYEILTISGLAIDYSLMLNYQTLTLMIELNENLKQNNLLVDIYVYSNKETLMRKIITKFI